MTRPQSTAMALLWLLACGGGLGCQLKRPDVIPIRMIEPLLIEPVSQLTPASSSNSDHRAAEVVAVRLLETQSRDHIGRRLLHQEANGELVEDPAWRWSSAPARYLDSALRIAFESTPRVRLVDSGTVVAMAVTLTAWHLESTDRVRLVGAVELVVTGSDRTVHDHVIRSSEPVSSELPGDLAAAAGRLLQRLASASLTRVIQGAGTF
jgi:phage terminase large subunit-like protein